MSVKLLVVDGHNMFIRHYVVNPTMDMNGERVGGMLGMVRNVSNLIAEHRPEQCVVVWDGHGGSARRRSIYGEYKAGRRVRLNSEYDFGDAKSDLENMDRQQRMTRETLTLLGVPQVRCDDVEADDLIAYTARDVNDGKAVVVSTDKDMLQLVCDRISVYNPVKKKMYDRATFMAEVGVMPENYPIMKALTGDKSDNIAGVKGFGGRTVVKMFPFLAERVSDVSDVIVAAMSGSGTLSERCAASEGTIRGNMQLVDLTNPMISAQASREARAANGAVTMACREIDTRILLQKEGVTIDDQTSSRLFRTFREFTSRRHPRCGTCSRPIGSRCPNKCDEAY